MSTRRPSNTSATRYPAKPPPYASDRSPLQKLEVTLDSISKEEKRARLEEAELRAQERAAVKRAKAPEQYRESKSQPSRKPPEQYAPPPREPARERSTRSSSDRTAYPPPDPPYNRSAKASQDQATTRALRAELYNNAAPIPDVVPTREGRSRSDSGARVLRKPPPPDVAASYGTAPAAAIAPIRQRSVREGQDFGHEPNYPKAKPYAEPHVDEPVRRDFASGYEPPVVQGPTVSNKAPPAADASPRHGQQIRFADMSHKHREGPPSFTSGTTATGMTGAGASAAEVAAEGHHHRWDGFHHHDDELRRFQPLQYRDYTKKMHVARIMKDETESAASRDEHAGLGKSGTSKRRSSAGPSAKVQSSTYDGSYEELKTQTYFQPQLYLKCGPLLRFTGIQRHKGRTTRSSSSRSEPEIWTGSIMIVTVDGRSQTSTPPTLRIFKQPIELLPPPPAEINEASGQQLPPEYDDPVAGQAKMSRVGKTLYVKPVEALEEHRDLSRVEDDNGLFEEARSTPYSNIGANIGPPKTSRIIPELDGEKLGKYQELPGYVLHQERGVTFWRFNIQVELGDRQIRIAYRINSGPAMGFWVPARGETMNMMFHSCNGFSLSVDPNAFSGPDPLWRDVLNSHQTRPFHVMLGGGDQIYNDAATRQTRYFGDWAQMRNPVHKHSMPFSAEMQDELEEFYLNRYAMWFSQGLFGMAISQIPMVNMWDDHDIIDGFGSYPNHTMNCPVMSGVGQVAFKYYMLFQHQALPIEDERVEPSWLLGAQPGPFIPELSRSLFMFLGRHVAFLGLDCRTERMRDEILSQETWDLVFARLKREIVKGETNHLIVLLGVPIAYPRLNFLENVLTSRLMDPVKALGRTGMLGNFVNKFDGGVEILDDLDDHWTAKHHKQERNWFIQELQELAAEKSVRITILGGDVHLCAVGQFYSNKKLGIPKDQDHRYMPNVISSAIVNTPPGDMLADVLNKRNKVHHLDDATDEDMIAMFHSDVNNKPRNNHHLLPRRNWCAIREYIPELTPPATPSTPLTPGSIQPEPPRLTRTLSLGRGTFAPSSLLRRFSTKRRRDSASHPPISYPQPASKEEQDYFNHRDTASPRRASADMVPRPYAGASQPPPTAGVGAPSGSAAPGQRPNPFMRRPTTLIPHLPNHQINLQHGLDIRLNVENEQGDPAGTTSEYRLLVPSLDYRGASDPNTLKPGPRKGKWRGLFETLTERGQASPPTSPPTSPEQSLKTTTNETRDSMSPEQPSPLPVERRSATSTVPSHPSTSGRRLVKTPSGASAATMPQPPFPLPNPTAAGPGPGTLPTVAKSQYAPRGSAAAPPAAAAGAMRMASTSGQPHSMRKTAPPVAFDNSALAQAGSPPGKVYARGQHHRASTGGISGGSGSGSGRGVGSGQARRASADMRRSSGGGGYA